MSREGSNIDRQPEAIDKRGVGWVSNKQKLICLMTLGDGIGVALSRTDSPFFRAFIVEDRITRRISANMRFRYHDRVCWYSIRLKEDEQQKKSRAEKVTHIQEGLEQVLAESFTYFANGAPPPKGWIACHYPPDDERDWQKTADSLFELEPRNAGFKIQSGPANQN